MTEETPAFNPMEMRIESNSAPVEQQSTEMVTTEPKTSKAELFSEEPKVKEVAEPVEEVKKANPADDSARRAIEAELRAKRAEDKVKELTPKEKSFDKEPSLDQYETLETFLEDHKKWAKAEARKEYDSEVTSQRQQAERAKVQADIQLKAKDSRAKHADFDKVVAPLAQVMDSIPILNDFVSKNPMGVEVAYELAKQPALLEQMRNLNMWEAGEMLLNMAARLKKPAASQISNAPDPIKPIGSRESVKPRLMELAEKDINGFMALRNKQERERKKAN